jgi:4-carboxymuconolactone decarboxylase
LNVFSKDVSLKGLLFEPTIEELAPTMGASVQQHDESARERGQSFYERVFGHRRRMGRADALAEMTIDHLFANVWSRPGLSPRDRSLITVALLAAQGRDDELRSHIAGATNQGISADGIEEIMIHVAHYAGWPAGHHGLKVATDLWVSAPPE